MDLEQRVNLLEQEVKLLKTEVQATLLDIQEQLLSTRFSDLRAEAGRQPQTLGVVTVGSDFEKQSATPARPANLKVVVSEPEASSRPGALASEIDLSDDEPLEPENTLAAAIHPVPSKGGRSAKAAPLPGAALAPNGSHKPAALPKPKAGAKFATDSPLDWEMMRQQTDWTIQTVRKHGPERTRRLIEAYTQSGLLSDKVSVVLQRVAAAFQPEGALAEHGTGPATKAAEQAEGIEALDKVQKLNIIRRIINGLQSSGAVQEPPHG